MAKISFRQQKRKTGNALEPFRTALNLLQFDYQPNSIDYHDTSGMGHFVRQITGK
ncbi:MAG: hypothetical protein GY761_02600 [Hyphomicrobiales bacterium]|nr:hypothetical protein [Hyphomicrobiales bacterium]